MEEKKCPACGAPVSEEAKHCPECGANLELIDTVEKSVEEAVNTTAENVQNAAEEVKEAIPAVEMKKCISCGAPIPAVAKHCPECGSSQEAKPQPSVNVPPVQENPQPQQPPFIPAYQNQQPEFVAPPYVDAPVNDVKNNKRTKKSQANIPILTDEDVKYTPYEPISTLGWIGYKILMAIPIVGFILLIVWACGGTRKKSLQNYARSYWVVALIVLILTIIAIVVYWIAVGNPFEKIGEIFQTVQQQLKI